jgi:hypothetical protein
MPAPIIQPKQVMLGLPAERLAQLRALADHHGVTAVEIIERAIRRGIEAEEITDDLPGLCEVEQIENDALMVTIRGQKLPHLDRLQVSAFAALLDAAAGREPLPGREFKVGSALTINLWGGDKLFIGRHVRAVQMGLVNGETGEIVFRTATTFSLASDLAALLRKRAKGLAPSAAKILADGAVVATEAFKPILNSETKP